jgi:carbamoylphosphate synthase large subunit
MNDQPLRAYRHADPATMLSRQLAIIDAAQDYLDAKLRSGEFTERECKTMVGMCSALNSTVQALARSSKFAEELAARMTPRQLLDAAIEKLEAQDEPTLTYCIRRLRAARAKIPVKREPATTATAVGALASLGTTLETGYHAEPDEDDDEV